MDRCNLSAVAAATAVFIIYPIGQVLSLTVAMPLGSFAPPSCERMRTCLNGESPLTKTKTGSFIIIFFIKVKLFYFIIKLKLCIIAKLGCL
jgi:hypothetical protein